jgi:hypothetical protein
MSAHANGPFVALASSLLSIHPRVQLTDVKENQVSASSSTTAASDTDPNRRFNPDVLLTIAECLEDIKHYQSVISLSCVSRHFADSLKPFRVRLRKRAILRLGDVDVDSQRGWSSVKYVFGPLSMYA